MSTSILSLSLALIATTAVQTASLRQSAAQPTDAPTRPTTPAELLRQAVQVDRPVAGTQDTRYLRASDIRPGALVADLEELIVLEDGDLILIPVSNWGHYRYRLSVVERSPRKRPSHALPEQGTVPLETLRWQDLSALSTAHGARLTGTIDHVEAGARSLLGTFRFAGEDVRARLDLLAARRGGPKPEARWQNLPYGPHWQQTIDFYPAPVSLTRFKAAPLVVAIHGGGWGALDKDDTFGLQQTLPALGIHFASINYRFIHTAPEHGIKPALRMPLRDAARAVQTLRWLARELRIDPQRVGAVGGSAGAFTALWLAFHADMAEPRSADYIARESTRLQAVAGIDAQTSIDPAQMRDWIPEITYGAHAFGIYHEDGPAAAFDEWLAGRAQWLPWIERLSPYALVSSDAPPIYLSYPDRGLTPAPGEKGWAAHAPQFGVQLLRRLDALGVESYLSYRGNPDPRFGNDYQRFLVDVLKRPAAVTDGPRPNRASWLEP